MAAPFSLIVSCEHASAAVPPAYSELFHEPAALLATHRASDLGAFAAARELAAALKAQLLAGEVTRLLVDLNRNEHNPRVFSDFSRSLSLNQRAELLTRYHAPYRTAVTSAVQAAGKPVLHLAVHSFTPVLNGQTRRADIGLLYDPNREPEKRLALKLQRALREREPTLRVRRNYPYRGVSDGLTTSLRRQFTGADYLGLELELNQADWNPASQAWQSLPRHLIAALQALSLE